MRHRWRAAAPKRHSAAAARGRWPVVRLCLASLLAFWAEAEARAQAIDGAALARAVGQGDLAAAEAILAAGPATALDEAFFQGLVLKAEARFDAAVAVFEAILAQDPGYLDARRERAHSLMLARNFQPAREEFRRLVTLDSNPAMRRTYRGFIRRIEDERPVSVRGFVTLRPSTNPDRGTSADTFETDIGTFVIDDSAQEAPGVALEFGLFGAFRHAFDPRHRLALDWSLSRLQQEDEITTLDFGEGGILVGSGELTFERRFARGHVAAGPFLRRVLDDGDESYVDRGVLVAFEHALAERQRLELSLRHADREFDVQTYRDGPVDRIDLSLSHVLAPGVVLRGGPGFERERPEAGHLRFEAVRLGAGLSRSWDNGISGEFWIEGLSRNFEDDFPFTSAPRRDRETRLGAALLVPQIVIAGRIPVFSCEYRVQDSTVSLYDFSAFDCGISLDFDL